MLLPAGIALGLTIVVAGRFTHRVSPHVQVSFGLALLALSFLLMATGFAVHAVPAAGGAGRAGAHRTGLHSGRR
ncbi:hypothetical protein ACTMU2_41155 [Cupriavidus basilensis]